MLIQLLFVQCAFVSSLPDRVDDVVVNDAVAIGSSVQMMRIC